jgi:hypothetical protein
MSSEQPKISSEQPKSNLDEAKDAIEAINNKLKAKNRKRKHGEKNISGASVQASKVGLVSFMSSSIAAAQFQQKTKDPKVRIQNCISKIEEFLKRKCEENEGPSTAEQIFHETKIDLNEDKDVFNQLIKHKQISYEFGKYRFKPEFEAGDENQLLNTLREELFITRKKLEGNKDSEKNLKQFVEDGIVLEFPSNEGRDKVYFYYDSELRNMNPRQSFRSLWGEQRIPDNDDSRNDLCKELHIDFVKALPVIKHEEEENEEPEKRRRGSRKPTVNQSILGNI